jgi:hypothetical protein
VSYNHNPISFCFTHTEFNLIRDILKSWDGWIQREERIMNDQEEVVYKSLIDRFKEQV